MAKKEDVQIAVESGPVDVTTAVAPAMSEKDALTATISSTVGGKVYQWPLEAADSILDAIELATNFVAQNLKDGQKFCLNIQHGTLFFLPECGIRLNADNPVWVYDESKINKTQLSYLIFAIRSGSILPGDYQVSRVIPKVAPSVLDCSFLSTLSEAMIRAEIGKVLSKPTSVTKEGDIVSPGADIEALIKYEKEHNNRRQILDLLYDAQKKAVNAIGFMGMDEIKKEDERLKMSSATATAGPKAARQVAQSVGVGVNPSSLI